MFCEKCGTKNKEDSQFCESCGSKITNNEKKEVSKKRKPPKKITIIIGCILVLLVAAYFIVGNMLNPKSIAEGYFKAVTNFDGDKLYNYISVKDSEFTSKKVFKKIIKDMKDDSKNDKDDKVMNYKVSKPEYSADGLTATVKITYLLKSSSDSEIITIKLSKNKSNKFLVFDNWQISEGGFSTTKDFEVEVPKSSKVSIGDIKVDKKYLDSKKSTDSLDVYVIPTLFTVKYNITVTLPLGIEIKDTIDGAYDRDYTLRFDEDNLNENDKKNILESTKTDLQTLYNGAKDNKSWDEVKASFEYEKGNLDNLKTAYENLASSLGNSSTKLSSITFSDTKISSAGLNSDGYLYLSVKANYSYNVSYTSGDEAKTHDSTDYDYIYLTYDYVDSKFKLIDATSLNTYFSKYY